LICTVYWDAPGRKVLRYVAPIPQSLFVRACAAYLECVINTEKVAWGAG